MHIQPITNTYTWDQLARFLGVDTPEKHAEDVWESVVNGDYSWAMSEAKRQLGDEATEEEIEAKAQEMEDESINEECSKCDERYRGAIRTVAENLFREHLLYLTEVEEEGKESHFVVEPMGRQARKSRVVGAKINTTTGWYRAASKIIETINGVGYFHFHSVRELLESGLYESVKDAVLQHAHWISSYPEVYEGTKARHLVYRRMR